MKAFYTTTQCKKSFTEKTVLKIAVGKQKSSDLTSNALKLAAILEQ